MIIGATTLKGAVGISVPSTRQFAITQLQQNDQQLILKKAQQIFDFKQKLKNNCSGFAAYTNTAVETLGGIYQHSNNKHLAFRLY